MRWPPAKPQTTSPTFRRSIAIEPAGVSISVPASRQPPPPRANIALVPIARTAKNAAHRRIALVEGGDDPADHRGRHDEAESDDAGAAEQPEILRDGDIA